ncbi:uncharacterized protein BYT42DRAFT_257242 [Radiomyces spectabilis]|uniref:uncharacterized protein n=1 Tax=Radiomyces spectabilis TaxID=64574 RepID=UPI00221FFECF|nr:uncharacterized protein BYT42DRAFT_257242 [Radiomyces spectabilis]KAI8384330.1 hypothetical protein BYT42DRAFT_257242 [Radiomyces spectabilis]
MIKRHLAFLRNKSLAATRTSFAQFEGKAVCAYNCSLLSTIMSRQGPANKIRVQLGYEEQHGTFAANDQSKITTLRCVFCNQDKQLDAFSKTQVTKATFNPITKSRSKLRVKSVRKPKARRSLA